MDKLQVLLRFGFFQNAPRELQQEILGAARLAQLPEGAYFYREGNPCAQFALIGSGTVRVFKIGETGREITLYHVQDGETCLVNMLCAFLDRGASAHARAETNVEAALVPATTFRHWVRTTDAIRDLVFASVAARMADLMTLIEEVTFHRMDKRLATFLERRLGAAEANGGVVTSTHEEIAAELGTAREVVSRLLRDFERVGAVELGRGRIVLRDAARLAEFASA